MSEQDWREKLPESVRALSIVQTTETEEMFWKRIADQQSHLGQSIRIPSGEASPEVMAEFREKLKSRIPSLMEVPAEDDDAGYLAVLEKLGKPSKADEYALPSIEGYQFSPEESAALREMGANSNMTKKQFAEFAKQVARTNAAKQESMKGMLEAERDAIKKDWGMAAEEKYADLTQFAKDTNAPPALIAALEGRTATVSELKWLEGMRKNGVEKPNISQQHGSAGAPTQLTPYEARERINEILNNPTHGYHRMEKTAVARMLELQAAANPA